jgi:hypothetical protein
MQPASQNFTQLHTVFGGGYVAEQRGDERRGHLPPADDRAFDVDFGEILKALRAALSIR